MAIIVRLLMDTSCDQISGQLSNTSPYCYAGPGDDDSYVDVRTDYIKNEVAVDYNAGFTGALAALNANPFTWNQCVAGQYIIPRGTNIG